MGMVKSAGRMLLSSGEDADHPMSRRNEVLYPLKKPDMFVTFCFLTKKWNVLQVGLAGHPAILQFSARTNEVKQYECPNMPETANSAGEEFGISRPEAELQKCGRGPLDAICRSVLESVARHGGQFDDQSLLLIRQTSA
jgi:hypothetical protein